MCAGNLGVMGQYCRHILGKRLGAFNGEIETKSVQGSACVYPDEPIDFVRIIADGKEMTLHVFYVVSGETLKNFLPLFYGESRTSRRFHSGAGTAGTTYDLQHHQHQDR